MNGSRLTIEWLLLFLMMSQRIRAFVFLADVAKAMGRISYQLSFKEMSLKQWRINFCS
jgi:hypothetical protein